MWRASWDVWTPTERFQTHQSPDHLLHAQSACKHVQPQSEYQHHMQSMWKAGSCVTLSQHPGQSGWSTPEKYEWNPQIPDSEPEQKTHCTDKRNSTNQMVDMISSNTSTSIHRVIGIKFGEELLLAMVFIPSAIASLKKLSDWQLL